jgi:mono/diheme cytochrome c family protein
MLRRSIVVAAAAAVLLAAPASAAQDPVAAGQAEYEQLCANCHGRTATGDGPIAAILTVKPADLTQISKRNGGMFPLQQIYQLIDGRVVSPAHGTSRMPIWGSYYTEKSQLLRSILGENFGEDYVRGRILSLVYYLQSIQKN